MTAHIVWDCNGHRRGEPCRGKLHVATLDPARALSAAERAGWKPLTLPGVPKPDGLHLCPSGGHDEQKSDRQPAAP